MFLFLSAAPSMGQQSSLQFDVFLGFDGVSCSAGWIPVACEVYNDGPGFEAQFELSAGGAEDSIMRRFAVELPSKTRKRFVLPVFSVSKYTYWRARLVDEKGRERALLDNLRPVKEVSWNTAILGVLGRGLIRTPEFPEIKANRKELQPTACRMHLDLFPDNPLALESLTALYLNSTIAMDLTPGQASAIYTWMERGGHLIVGVEQPSDLAAAPWLQKTLPMRLSTLGQVAVEDSLHSWLVGSWRDDRMELGGSDMVAAQRKENAGLRVFGKLSPDREFAAKSLLVANGQLTDGRVVASKQGLPLIVEARRGYGKLTLLTFNPDRAPVAGWKHQPWFWLKLLHPNMEVFESPDFSMSAGSSLDGLIAAMIETKQVRKLPVVWLLILLVVYLAVIGPFDWFTLKKLRRQMLTWITFPIYVALFSGLIYFIGFKLRAGKVEWNDLSVIDVWPQGDTAFLCGRTYGSIYSPANESYKLGGPQPVSAMRGEYVGRWNNAEEIGQGEIRINGSRTTELGYVPIWTSRLFITDWLDSGRTPFRLEVHRSNAGWSIELENKMDHTLSAPSLVVGERLHTLADVPPKGILRTNVSAQYGSGVSAFVDSCRAGIEQAIQRHQSAFGEMNQSSPIDARAYAMAASLMPDLASLEPQRSFLTRDHLVISPEMRRDLAILMVWDDGADLARPIPQFGPAMQTRRNLLRLAVPIADAAR